MKNNPSIVYYIIAVFIGSVLFKAFGLIEFSVTEYSGYVLIFYGIIVVFNHFGKYERIALFGGTIIFLIGILLLTVSYFEFTNFRVLIVPSFLFISSAGFLVLFIEDFKYYIGFILSVLFFALGITIVLQSGKLEWITFSISLWNVLSGYWAVFIVAIVIVFLYSRRKE